MGKREAAEARGEGTRANTAAAKRKRDYEDGAEGSDVMAFLTEKKTVQIKHMKDKTDVCGDAVLRCCSHCWTNQ